MYLASLWSEALTEGWSLSRCGASPTTSDSQRHLNARRAKLAVQNGQYNKEITETAVRQGVRSFPNGSAPGPSGLRSTHLREAMGCPSTDRSSQVDSVCEPFGLWQSSTCHPTPSLWGHPSRHPEKEWWSPAHRRRGSSAAADVQVPLLHLPFHSPTRPSSLTGIGVKCGCEAIIHAISSLMSSGNPAPHWTLLDFSNAFKNISREAMFKQIRRHTSLLLAWMESCYSSQGLLRLGQDTVLSCCEVQQGDPLSPLGFALSLHPIVCP